MPPKVDGTNNNQQYFNAFEPRAEKPPVLPPPILDLTDRNLLLRQNNLGGDTLKFDLFNRLQEPVNVVPQAPPPPPIDETKVANAVATIKDRLDEGFLGDVSHGDLEDIRGVFVNLNNLEATQVVSRLSGDDLTKWADELDGTLGSFDGGEKKTLFDQLAGKLDAVQLARFTNALGDGENIKSLADSVAHNSSDEIKLDSITRFKGFVEKNGGSAIAVAELIAGLGDNPVLLDKALGGLSPAQLSAVVEAATQKEYHSVPSFNGGIGSDYTTFDPAPLVDMLAAASKSGNAALKADVFQAASLQLKNIEDSGGYLNQAIDKTSSARDVRTALTGLLKSDTNGIARRLEIMVKGDGLAAYLKSSIDNGETANVRDIIGSLTKGVNGSTAQKHLEENFGDPGEPALYLNARALGFFAGCLDASVKQITSDVEKQAETFKNIFGVASGAAGAINPITGAVSALANGLTNEAAALIVDGINSGHKKTEEALFELMLPPEPSDIPRRGVRAGDPYSGVAKDIYNSSFGAASQQFAP